MKGLVCAVLLGLLFLDLSAGTESPPKVQVYTRLPGEFGKSNVFICHATDFYPPEIQIDLLNNGKVIPGATQTDLAFEESWHYHLTKHVSITPKEGDQLACRVTHLKKTNTYSWESDF